MIAKLIFVLCVYGAISGLFAAAYFVLLFRTNRAVEEAAYGFWFSRWVCVMTLLFTAAWVLS